MQQILVTAATGNVGASLVEALQKKNMNFTAATRNEEKARDKLGSAVDTVFMDYEQPESLGSALNGHDILFLSGASSMPHAEQLLIPMVEKAQKHNIDHIVFIATYPKLAKAVKESGIDYTGIAPN
ncbi:MAG TPA: NAD(P)H-binding protein, partial [Balneolaceae bacterium]|nr:NAD(P)H-binding protein [Balneolaceae bacterium]